ncbi:phosphocholine cytidylyltransferase family protein [Marinobacter adhaerens]|uniref:phosphocholine cytidylyltransferase family protein n=1 Tax=Marinobacter adhaerens TaxID=1033846 RepID=UPI001C58F59C|nr:phosphocholine cytidylyltransferase family protein [Marinobacter adhaerens]MBW3226018.1 phosphocholine cytidylyltransferase family protein [Marinobacter adhaerens]
MKVIVLAAGQGTRLRPYTNDRPKCMVELAGKPLLHRQLETLKACGIEANDIALVGGYLKEKLNAPGVHIFVNERFEETNMVSTLFCAESFVDPGHDLLICYGDIVYEQRVLETLLRTDGDIVLAADQQWRRLWSLRMDEPLADAETFKIASGKIVELGKKPRSYDEVQAQYMGLIKIRFNKVKDFVDFYNSLDKAAIYDGKDFENMYMTSFLQALIDSGWNVRPALISNGWLEVDTATELERYNKMQSKKLLSSYIELKN